MLYNTKLKFFPVHGKLINRCRAKSVSRRHNHIDIFFGIQFCHFCNCRSFSNTIHAKNHKNIYFSI